MREQLQNALQKAVSILLSELGDEDPRPILRVEIPRSAEHGDFASNAAMLLCKRVNRSSREVAGRLIEILEDADGLVERAEIAGPGFINFWLSNDRWRHLIQDVLTSGSKYGSSEHGSGCRVQVEFVSANPTGPLSLGHGRQAVLGDCIARLLEYSGYEVTREYYFNNAGRQMKVLGESVRARYLQLLGRAAPPPLDIKDQKDVAWPSEIDGLPVLFPRDGYQGDYIIDIARGLVEREGDGLAKESGVERFSEEAENVIFKEIIASTEAIGVNFDVYYNERSLYDDGKVAETLKDLRAKSLIYESEGATWFEATQFGLERDRVLVKSNGDPTYLLPDIAYHRDKFYRGFDFVIDLQGADHVDQFPYVHAAAVALGVPDDRIELVMNQFVTLRTDGRSVKQSTRAATFVTVDELVRDVGVDVFRLFMIQRKPDGHLDFDFDLALETDWTKNPAYYLQYAHARICGIEREAGSRGIGWGQDDILDFSVLNLSEEIELLRKVGEFPDVVQDATSSREPHHLSYYLRELAGLWNPYIQDGKRHRVLSEDRALSLARLALCRVVRTVLSNGLNLLGIRAPEKM